MEYDGKSTLPDVVLAASLIRPKILEESAWLEHGPFAFALMSCLKPSTLVELGTFRGYSYFAFCQAVHSFGLKTKCFAVDNWSGDPHGGFYAESVYQVVVGRNQEYRRFSKLLRSDFSKAAKHFAEGSIDLLHIDGYHTEEAVTRDFETWKPMLSKNAVVLFHDTNVRTGDFGVWKFFAKARRSYHGFEFKHGHGLGLLFLGEVPDSLKWLDNADPALSKACRSHFAACGSALASNLKAATVSVQLEEPAVVLQNEFAKQRTQARKSAAQLLRKQRHKFTRASRNFQRRMEQSSREHQRSVEYATQHAKSDTVIGLARLQAEADRRRLPFMRWCENIWSLVTRGQRSDYAVLAHSFLFDRQWYLGQNTDVAASKIDPIRHYLEFGALEGRDPGRLFSTAQYYNANPDVRANKVNPLIHFHRFGASEGRSLYPLHANLAPPLGTPLGWKDDKRCIVLCTKHTEFVGNLIQSAFAKIGVDCPLIFEEPVQGFEPIPHIVVSAQSFARLPPVSVIFQMEQSVSSRWFNKAYFGMLNSAMAVLDYSIDNLEFLRKSGIPTNRLFYMPLGALPGATFPNRKALPIYDVAFYGDINCPRRKELLDHLQQYFRVSIISEVFGDKLRERLDEASVVVNLHYYENALLETTRIYECLSEGRKIVSEVGSNHAEHVQLEGLVDFVPVGDKQALVAAIHRQLASATDIDKDRLEKTSAQFQYHFYRFLLWADEITFDEFYDLTRNDVHLSGSFVCLSLPEYTERFRGARDDRSVSKQMFVGIRHRLGWLGCGMSYKYLMRKAQEQRLSGLTVYEDDVEWLENWEDRFHKAIKMLSEPGFSNWQIFSGLIADLHPEAKVVEGKKVEAESMLMVDKMTSTVFNCYRAEIFETIAKWDERNTDANTNTIDRYLERVEGLRVAVLLPYLVGHQEEQQSTIWGTENVVYRKLISQSEILLEKKAEDYFDGQRPDRNAASGSSQGGAH